jgi:thiol-disulfide isomerase/thioredoxin
MNLGHHARWFRFPLLAALLALAAPSSFAQGSAPPAPAPAPAPAAPAPSSSPVQGIRNKISAGDLLSAESMAEVWRIQHGEDGPWLVGYSWLARGALLLGEAAKATRYADSTYFYCRQRLAGGADLEKDGSLETALGAAVEVKAQLLERARGRAAATRYVRDELTNLRGTVALTARLNKRLNMLTLVGQPAPELVLEESPGGTATTLAALRGKPVLLFLFAYGCGDCRAQEPLLESIRARHRAEGLEVVAVTRWYDDPKERIAEKASMDSVWTSVYTMGSTPRVISTASMERYGGSSTPTFVFIDRAGVVRGYTPTRLTEAEFERALAPILR